MTTSPFSASARPPRILSFIHLQRLDRASDLYLQDCYRTKTAVRASEFAASLGVTHSYLSGMVRQLTGMTLIEYLRAKQLRYAEQLLQVKQLTVEEIAVRSGFGTPATFYRYFGAKHGMTPTAFRNMKK